MAKLIFLWSANVLAALETIEPPTIVWPFPDVSPSSICNDSVNKKSKRETFSRLLLSLYWTEPHKVATVWHWNEAVIHQGEHSPFYLQLLPRSTEPAKVLTGRPPDRSHRALVPSRPPDASLSTFVRSCLNSDLIWFIAAARCQPLWPVLCQHRPYRPLSDFIMEGKERKKKGKKTFSDICSAFLICPVKYPPLLSSDGQRCHLFSW